MLAIGEERKMAKAWEGRTDIIKWEVIEIENYQKIKFDFISSNSSCRQGFRIAIDFGDGKLKYEDIESKSFEIWMDNSPKSFVIECFSERGRLSLYNIWDEGSGSQSQCYTSGMLQQKEGKRIIYYCNDFGKETNFDKLVFSLEKI